MCVSEEKTHHEWVLDSGCSFHMCPNKDWFISYTKNHGGQVLLGNNKACKVTGIGAIKLKLADGVTRILQEVRHVPELKRNLISLGMLDAHGYGYKAEGGVLKVTKGSLVVMKGRLENGLYLLQGRAIVDTAATVSGSEQSRASLWHMRLGHISEGGLRELSK